MFADLDRCGHGCSSRRRPAGLIAVLAVVAALITGGSMLPPTARADQSDPSQPGPFNVGVTERSFTRASSTKGTAREITMVIWYPALPQAPGEGALTFHGRVDAPSARDSGPFPVLLFSHGSGGTPWQSTFLTAHLASHGFVVIAPTHPGNTLKDCPAACLPLDNIAREAFLDSAANRPTDVSAALDQAIELSTSKDKVLEGLIDANRAGAFGHSFGGWTAL
jgi:predicted dienelactone hydrolase